MSGDEFDRPLAGVLEAAVTRVRGAARRPAPPRPNTCPDRRGWVEEAEALVHRAEWDRAVPARLRSARLEDLTGVEGGADIAGWASGVAPGWRAGQNLVLLGDVGVGKSHAAVAAVREVLAAGVACQYWPAAELVAALHWDAPDHRAVMVKVQRAGCLVIDDLGTEGPNDWTQRQWYRVLEHRCSARLPTVVPSNLEPADLEEAVGARCYSRLVGGALAVRLVGPDRRRTRHGGA